MSDAIMPDTTSKGGTQQSLPPDALIILPVRQAVLFPGIVLPLTIGRPPSIAAAQEAVRTEQMLGVVLQTDPSVDDAGPGQLHEFGTSARVLRYVTAPDGSHHVICQGVRRFRVVEFISGFPFLAARVEEIGASEVFTRDRGAFVSVAGSRAGGAAAVADRSSRNGRRHREHRVSLRSR